MCGSSNIIWCEIEPCCFDSKTDKDYLGTIIGLIINHCQDCGFTNLENQDHSKDALIKW